MLLTQNSQNVKNAKAFVRHAWKHAFLDVVNAIISHVNTENLGLYIFTVMYLLKILLCRFHSQVCKRLHFEAKWQTSLMKQTLRAIWDLFSVYLVLVSKLSSKIYSLINQNSGYR